MEQLAQKLEQAVQGGGPIPGGLESDVMSEADAKPPNYRQAMTLEQKRMVSANFRKLSDEKLIAAVDIIRENMPTTAGDEGDIVIDIDSLDNKALWDLYDYIESALPKRKKKKRVSMPAPSRAAAAMSSSKLTWGAGGCGELSDELRSRLVPVLVPQELQQKAVMQVTMAGNFCASRCHTFT